MYCIVVSATVSVVRLPTEDASREHTKQIATNERSLVYSSRKRIPTVRIEMIIATGRHVLFQYNHS